MLQTLNEALDAALSKDYVIGKVKNYYVDKWTKETGTVRSVVKGIKAKDAYGFQVGKYSFMVNPNQKSTIGNTQVYKATDENNDQFIVYVDDAGTIYSDDKSSVASLKKLIK